ncbi:MAG: M28 family peptidase [Planctomycetes bacterium]|nr:M28 family peptidase [Planctomycetota bacterium]
MSAFDPARARAFAGSAARPRLCGTAGEREVAAIVKGALAEAGLDVSEEAFEFRPVADGLIRVRTLVLLAGFVAVAAGPWTHWGVSAAGLAWNFVWWARLLPALARARYAGCFREAGEAPAWIRAANLTARPDGPEDGPLLVFIAHLDSKSQSLSLRGLLGLLAAQPYLGAAVLATSAAALAMPGSPRAIPAAAAALLALAALPLLFIRTGNASPGALDNASGLGVLVELARVWKTLPAAKKCRALFVATSAEEHGMIGARAWLRKHRWELDGAKRVSMLNFDSVGYAGPVRFLPESSPLAPAIREAALAAGVRLEPFPARFDLVADHTPFVRAGFACATLATHSWDAGRMHTPRDTVETLSDEGFANVGRILIGYLDQAARERCPNQRV